MGLITIMKRGGEDYREYKEAVKMAKEAIDTICELTSEMEEQYGERGGSGERSSYRGGSSYRRRAEWDEMDERRGRDSMGRYR